MNPLDLLKYGSLLLQYGPQVQQIWSAATSNGNFVNTIENEIPLVANFATKIAHDLFPSAEPAVAKAAAIAVAFNHALVMKGQQGVNLAIQAGLIKLEGVTYAPGKVFAAGETLDVDGYYGPKTHAAIAVLQKKLGLTADGWFGKLSEQAAERLIPALKSFVPAIA